MERIQACADCRLFAYLRNPFFPIGAFLDGSVIDTALFLNLYRFSPIESFHDQAAVALIQLTQHLANPADGSDRVDVIRFRILVLQILLHGHKDQMISACGQIRSLHGGRALHVNRKRHLREHQQTAHCQRRQSQNVSLFVFFVHNVSKSFQNLRTAILLGSNTRLIRRDPLSSGQPAARLPGRCPP